ncbi:hypothetical protein G6F57_021927 [Rhizopus arrhizus]|nr:hypothetical protein G6F68_019237 [Rhizopus microsporus]KAG1433773.1 hypothetical protein G6F57_021927 [Rhizopus arrhizus]
MSSTPATPSFAQTCSAVTPKRWKWARASARRLASVLMSPMITFRASTYMSSQKALGTPFSTALRSAMEQAALAVTPIMSGLKRRPCRSTIRRCTS